MRPECVLSPVQRRERMEKRQQLKLRREVNHRTPVTTAIDGLNSVFTEDEAAKLNQLVAVQNRHFFKEMGKFFVSYPSIFHNVLLASNYGSRFPIEDKRTIDRSMFHSRLFHFYQLEDVKRLKEADRRLLLLKNLPLIRELRESQQISQADRQFVVNNCRHIFTGESRSTAGFDELVTKMNSMEMNDDETKKMKNPVGIGFNQAG